LKAKLLSDNGVNSFDEITGDNLLSKISTISDTSAGRVAIRLSVVYSETSRSQVRELARKILSDNSSITGLATVTVTTKDNYYVEAASK
jgi:hypothetical protein